MNIIFKIKHYLLPYLNLKNNYSCNNKLDAKEISIEYWIKGYSHNISSKKWTIVNGIPMGLYTNYDNLPIYKRVHISGLTEYCFGLIEINKTENIEKVVNLIVDNLHFDEFDGYKYAYWKTFFDIESENYFVHGMGQGQILSLLIRYYMYYDSNDDIKNAIVAVSNSYLLVFSHKNGFVNKFENNTIIEEYPKSQNVTPHVLNGWILSIIGIYDYVIFASQNIDDAKYEEKKGILNETIDTIINHISGYDLNYWSCYNQPKSVLNIASIHYHAQHIAFLDSLSMLISNDEIKRYANKFRSYYKNPIYRIASLFSKLFICNIFKYKRIYK